MILSAPDRSSFSETHVSLGIARFGMSHQFWSEAASEHIAEAHTIWPREARVPETMQRRISHLAKRDDPIGFHHRATHSKARASRLCVAPFLSAPLHHYDCNHIIIIIIVFLAGPHSSPQQQATGNLSFASETTNLPDVRRAYERTRMSQAAREAGV